MTITITPEMKRHSIGYREALRLMHAARTQEAAAFFKASAERHRTELGWLLDEAIDPFCEREMSLAIAVGKSTHDAENGVEK